MGSTTAHSAAERSMMNAHGQHNKQTPRYKQDVCSWAAQQQTVQQNAANSTAEHMGRCENAEQHKAHDCMRCKYLLLQQ
jgi:hypothetical protein